MLSPLKRPNDILNSSVLFPEVCLKLAQEIANRSKDPSTKVGAVIWDPKDKRVISLGYNGFPSTIPDLAEIWNNRTDPSALMKYDVVIHAEMNAILNARCDLRGKQIFITHMPCPTCAKHIAACGITVAVWPTDSAAKSQNERDVDVVDYIFKASNIATRKQS